MIGETLAKSHPELISSQIDHKDLHYMLTHHRSRIILFSNVYELKSLNPVRQFYFDNADTLVPDRDLAWISSKEDRAMEIMKIDLMVAAKFLARGRSDLADLIEHEQTRENHFWQRIIQTRTNGRN